MTLQERRQRFNEKRRESRSTLSEAERKARNAKEHEAALARRAKESPQETEARRAKYRRSAQVYRHRDLDAYNASRRAYCAERYPKVKQQVFAGLGDKCAQCGISDWRVLQVDHLGGGGRAHRRRSGGLGYWNSILKNLADYQLLCANCHMIKSYPKGRVAT